MGVLGETLSVELVDAEARASRGEFVEEVGAEGLARTFAVPACAFGVGLAVFLLVGEGCVLECSAQIVFCNFVVVVEEFLGLGERVAIVNFRRELMCVLHNEVSVLENSWSSHTYPS